MCRANTTWLRFSLILLLASLLAEDLTKTYNEDRLATLLHLSKHKSREINMVYIVAIRELELTTMRRLTTIVIITITRVCEDASSVRTDLSNFRTS